MKTLSKLGALTAFCMPDLRPDGRLEAVDEKILFPDLLEDQV
jgi:hypothetical protein